MKRKEPLQQAVRDGQVPPAVDSFPSTVKSNVTNDFFSYQHQKTSNHSLWDLSLIGLWFFRSF